MSLDLISCVQHELFLAHGITCGDAFDAGHIVSSVYRARRGSEKLVVKIGANERSAKEVRRNWEGYNALSAIGASSLRPDYVELLTFLEVPTIVMSDCGPTFLSVVRVADRPENLYSRLVDAIRPVHVATLRDDADGNALHVLEGLRTLLARQYEEHLVGWVSSDALLLLCQTSFERLALRRVCFSSFDFTPENVCLTPHGVKYIDPPPEVLGIPIIDLACFAGVARDACQLPGSEAGYRILFSYACEELPQILAIHPQHSFALFCFGRALQCGLSARFRKESEPERALMFARKSESFLVAFLDLLS
ncbi:MAG: hypothetical protein AAB967_00870 [Patescibacteria group bacterium]